MKYRKLRIAWSVAWGIACLLLIALWVRSYWWVEQLPVPVPGNQVIGLATMPGVYAVVINPQWGRAPWARLSNSADEWLSLGGYDHSRIWGYFGAQATAVIIPFWFSVLIAAGIATIPWLSWRFSLRMLLIAMTLVAVGLGLAVYANVG
jgi:hypothetical protein